MDLDSIPSGEEDRPDTGRLGGFEMRAVGLLLATAFLVVACSSAVATPQPSMHTVIDEVQAGRIARDYFAGVHGTGIKLSDVRETDLGITNDKSCGAAWEVHMFGTVTESTGVSYGSHMYICVDPTSGTVTRGPAG